MSKSLRGKKNRFLPLDIRPLLKKRDEFNYRVNEEETVPYTLTWTSKTSLPAEASSPLRPQRGGSVTSIKGNVKTAPSGDDLEFRILFDGVDVNGGTTIKILDGDQSSKKRYATDRPSFNEDTKVQVELTEDGGATGPLVVTIEYVPAF